MALIDNLANYYSFNTNANDVHGSDDLIVSGATLTTGSGGILGECYTYDGSNDYLYTSADNIWASLSSQSFSFWLYVTTMPGGSSKDTVMYIKDNNFLCELYSTGTLRFYAVGMTTSGYVSATTSLSTGAWHHVGVSLNVSTGDLITYVDNSKTVFARTANRTWGSGDRSSKLGTNATAGGEWFTGKLDELGVWDRVLSDAEFSELYNSGAALAYPFSAGTAAFSKIDGVAWGGISTIYGVAKSSYDKLYGVSTT